MFYSLIFVQFHAIEEDMTITEIERKNVIVAPPSEHRTHKFISFLNLFLMQNMIENQNANSNQNYKEIPFPFKSK